MLGQQFFIKIGDVEIQYHNDFKMFITSKQANADFLPDLTTKVALVIQVTLVNFSVTAEGMVEQLLDIVINNERPDLKEKGQELTL